MFFLEYGEKVPADGVLLTGSLTIDESSITGESKEIYKYPFKTGTELKETNQLFRGSVIYQGTGKMLVTKVGVNTFYGKIAKELQDVQPESPLKSRLRHLATIISRIGYCSAFFVALSYLFFLSLLIINLI